MLNKVDRADARPEEVLDEIYQLFLDLEVPDHHIDFPVISAIAREGRAMAGVGMPAEDADLSALFEAIVHTVPAPMGDPGADYRGRHTAMRGKQATNLIHDPGARRAGQHEDKWHAGLADLGNGWTNGV